MNATSDTQQPPPESRVMTKALSEPNYYSSGAIGSGGSGGRRKSRTLNGHAKQTSCDEDGHTNPIAHADASSNSSSNASRSFKRAAFAGAAGRHPPSYARPLRTMSLRTSDECDDSVKARAPPELINLANMTKELGLGQKEQKRGSISFSAVGFMVESMHRMHAQIQDKKPDVERAVLEDDVDSLRSMCSMDEVSALVGALTAVKEDKEDMLENILDVVKGDPKTLEDKRDGHGLLHAAVKEGSENCVRLLLSRGFDSNGWNRTASSTPMHCAAETGQVGILQCLADEGAGDINLGEIKESGSVMHAAIRANQPEVVRWLIKRKANKMGKGKFTETALHAAAELNHFECAELLLQDGTLVDALRGPEIRETALHIAAANGYLETVKLLLKHSADANAKNLRMETPLHLAAKMLSGPVMTALIDHGADVDSRDRDGRPPLHFAINSKLKGGAECMSILIDRGSDINIADSNGTTALHLAALNRKLTRVKLLIRSGADLIAKNNANKSALHFVMKYVPNSLKTIEQRMDSGLQMENPESEYDNTIKMNFSCLIPSSSNINHISDVGLFTEILQMHNNDPVRLEKILMHPLSLSFLHLKWQQVKWLYYLLILFTHLIYSITYSIYVVLIFNTVCRPVEEDLKNFTWSNRMFFVSKCDYENHAVAKNFALTAWLFLIGFNILYTMKETTKLLHLRKRYFLEWESVLNLLTIVSFPLISFHSNPFSTTKPVTFIGWQFHAAGIGVLITWVLQMFLIGKVPRFGKYVQMLLTVAWSFVNFFVAYSSLIAGFSLAFVVLFPREVSFEEALGAPIKVMVMMTGEIEYNDLYYPQKQVINFHATNGSDGILNGTGEIEEITQLQYFPVTAHAVLTMFILIISIVIMNLLFGMAVSDVQELYKKSRLHQSIQQVHLISYMESMLTSPLFMKLPLWVKKFLRRKLHGLEGRYRNICEIEPDSYDDNKLLPNFVNKTIKDKCNEIHQKRDDQQVTLKTLQTSLLRMERQMAQMSEFLNKLSASQLSDANLRFNMPATSMEDSLSDGDGLSTAHQLFSKEELDGEDSFSDFGDSGRSPTKRESQLSMASATSTLAQIPEVEAGNSTDQSSSGESGRGSSSLN